MGRKNKRDAISQDKNWDKFVKSIVSENSANQTSKVVKRTDRMVKEYNLSTISTSSLESKPTSSIDYTARNKERLDYAIKQCNSLGIRYEVLDESLTLMVCYHKGCNTPIKYYASSGCVIGHPDSRGIKALLFLLLN